ncbi:MAG: ribonuclease HI [Candidatus Roizmanbacteria bacterium]
MLTLYTDGACSGNPGPGGYGFILKQDAKVVTTGSQGYLKTTNNRMELRGVIAGLQASPPDAIVRVVTDSEYIVNAFTKKWIDNWQARGWRNSQKKPVANRDLWELLLPLVQAHKVQFSWIRGHDGHAENEQCDALAVAASMSKNLLSDAFQSKDDDSLF